MFRYCSYAAAGLLLSVSGHLAAQSEPSETSSADSQDTIDFDDLFAPVDTATESESEAAASGDDASDAAPAAAEASFAASAEPDTFDETPESIPVGSEETTDVGQPERRQGQSRLLEEVIVTAQKREENVQDVPISISAFSAAALDAKGIDNPQSLALSIPGVSYGETVNFSIIYVRGVGTEAFLPDSDLSVAMYMDGIYFPFANGLSQSFGAIDRVEVLKGPQGTLFGRNATGGAFNITTKVPSFDPEVSISTGYGEFNQFTSRVYGNVPLTDTFAANVSLTYNVGDNYYDGTRGTTEGAGFQPLPRETEKGARVRLRWNPTEWMDLTLTGIKHYKLGLASSAIPNVNPSVLLQTFHTATEQRPYTPPPDYEVNIDVPSYFSLDSEVVYGQLDLHPRWFDIKLLASQQDITTDNNYDFDGTTAPFITFDARGQFADVFTGELQFISNGDWGPDWLEWVGGLYYLDQTVGFPLNRLSVGDLDLSTGSLLGLVPIPGALNDLLSAVSNLGVPIVDGVSLALRSLQQAEALAYFGQATAYVTDTIYVTVGGRYQEETRTVLESSVGVANLDGSSVTLIPFQTPQNDDTNFSPKLVLGYQPLDGSLFYASWSKGFKSGTYNTVNVYTNPNYIEPEEVTSIELGAKLGGLFDSQIQLNAAAFQNQIENQQVQVISLLAGGAVQLENAAEVEIYGAEAELQYTPYWDTGLFVSLSATWLDATYVSYPDASAFMPGTGLFNFGTGDFSGNRTVRTPEWSGNLTINKLFSFERGDLELGLTGYYSGDLYFQAQNHEASYQPEYFTLDAQLSFLHTATNIRLTLLGKNLTDERYALTQFHTDAGVQEMLAPPMTLGARLDWSFGS